MALKPEAQSRKDATTGASVRMEHRHYAFIASVLSTSSLHGASEKRVVAMDFADALAATNPKFDRARFLRACGIDA